MKGIIYAKRGGIGDGNSAHMSQFLKMLNTTDPKCWVDYLSSARVLLKANFSRIFPFRTLGFLFKSLIVRVIENNVAVALTRQLPLPTVNTLQGPSVCSRCLQHNGQISSPTERHQNVNCVHVCFDEQSSLSLKNCTKSLRGKTLARRQ